MIISKARVKGWMACERKNKYDKKTAQTQKNLWWRKEHRELRIYHCERCNYWHLTHQLDDEEDD